MFTLANRRYLDAIRAEKAAAQADDVENIKILEDVALEEAQWREFARKAVKNHAVMHAGKQPETRR